MLNNRRTMATTALSVALLMVAVLSGCATKNMARLNNGSDFQQQVMLADRPVVVEFYETGCPWCALLEPGLDRLAGEYRGRALFYRFEATPSAQVRGKYDINVVPTVILFVNGQERRRWVSDQNLDHYRQAIDAALAERGVTAKPAKAP